MTRYLHTAASATCLAVWLLALLWATGTMLVWLMARDDNSIHQCYYAARACASLVFGYVVARCLTELVGKVVELIRRTVP